MKRKEIIMVCFVLLVTILSAGTILYTTKKSTNNATTKNITETKDNVNTAEQTSNSNGPTVINQKDSNSKTSTDNSSSSGANNNLNAQNSQNKDTQTSSKTTSSDEKYISYKVKNGDTLASIVKNYSDKCPSSVLSKAILKTSNLSNASDIKEGIEVKIPEKYVNGSKYTIKTGDSLYSVALEKFKGSEITTVINQIKNDNFLSSDSIKIGDQLFISSNLDSTAVLGKASNTKDNSASVSTAPISDKEVVTYKVKDGETLSSITKKYEKYCPVSISSKAILKLNNFTDLKDVKAGVEIKIPEKYLTNGETYTIKQGDTLSTIAGNFFKNLTLSTAIDKIKSDNFMSSYNIKIGDKLYLTSLNLSK